VRLTQNDGYRYCAFCLAEPQEFLKVACWIVGDLVDDSSEKAGT
jgi:hypothetical protein